MFSKSIRCAVLFFGGLAAIAPAASADAQTKAVYVTGYSTTTTDPSKFYPASPYGGSVTYSKTDTVQNTFSGTAGLSIRALSATLGFQVDKSTAVSFSQTFNMSPNRSLTVTPTYGWEVATYDIYDGTKKLGRVTTKKLVSAYLVAR